MAGELKPCCEDLGNRAEGAGPRGLPCTPPAEVTVTHCRVCECRHFEVDVDPAELGLTVTPL